MIFAFIGSIEAGSIWIQITLAVFAAFIDSIALVATCAAVFVIAARAGVVIDRDIGG
jgi:hypothetical protein